MYVSELSIFVFLMMFAGSRNEERGAEAVRNLEEEYPSSGDDKQVQT